MGLERASTNRSGHLNEWSQRLSPNEGNRFVTVAPVPESSIPRPARTVIAVMVGLLLLISGAVAVDRFGGENSSNTGPERVAQPGTPETEVPASDAPAVVGSPGEQADAAIAATVPAAITPDKRVVRTVTRIPSAVTSGPDTVNLSGSGTGSGSSSPAATGGGSPNQPAPSAGPSADPSSPPQAPEPSPLLGAGATVGEGVNGAAAHVALPHAATSDNPQPDVDITIGRTQVIGDAPPSNGTSFEVSGSLLGNSLA